MINEYFKPAQDKEKGKKKLEILKKYFYCEETNTIDLSGITAIDINFNLRSLKAKNIYNEFQEARFIDNGAQRAIEIQNPVQNAKVIINSEQNAIDAIYNNEQSAINEIENKEQRAEKIDNREQWAKEINNAFQNSKYISNEYQEASYSIKNVKQKAKKIYKKPEPLQETSKNIEVEKNIFKEIEEIEEKEVMKDCLDDIKRREEQEKKKTKLHLDFDKWLSENTSPSWNPITNKDDEKKYREYFKTIPEEKVAELWIDINKYYIPSFEITAETKKEIEELKEWLKES